jgi:hypothetical protein
MNARLISTIVLVLLAALAVGLSIRHIDGPDLERRQRIDRTREQHLQEIDWAIANFARDRRRLPASLAELLDANRRSMPVDPVSRQAYLYRRIDATHYRLCASFEVAGDGPDTRSLFADHPAGLHCFTLETKAQP